MSMPTNVLQTVQTYQQSGLAVLQNLYCGIATANKKFKNFDRMTANLGDTVGIQLPTRFTTANGLVASFQGVTQRVQTLTCNQSANTAFEFTAQQFIFNVRDYMMGFGRDAMAELGAQIEKNILGNFETQPFRFYGNGVDQINSYTELASALALFRNFGAVSTDTKGYLQDTAEPGIVGSGLSQFAMERNNEIAKSWEVGSFSRCDWYQSNLLPIHTAGSEGTYATTLTVVSTTLDANGAVTAITFSGAHAASDPNSVLLNDSFAFQDGVSGYQNLRFRTFVGHQVSNSPVQFRATANAASTSGSQVTVSIYPPLQVQATQDQNINVPIVAGMQCKVLPSHRCGLIMSGNPFYLAMPALPDQTPFPTANKADPESGCSIRMYYGAKFGENQQGIIYDALWGSTIVPEYCMKLVFPV